MKTQLIIADADRSAGDWAALDTTAALTGTQAVEDESRDVKFVSLLLRASARVEHSLNAILVDWDLNLLQYRVLGAIVRDEISAPGKCAKQLHVTPPIVTRAVDQLYAKGLVSRVRGSSDRRAVTLSPTLGGVKCFEKARVRVDMALSAMLPSGDGGERYRLLSHELTRLAEVTENPTRFGYR